MNHKINPNRISYSESSKGKRSILDFSIFADYAFGLRLEIGCGKNRFSDSVLAIDRSVDSDADMIIDAEKLPFNDRTFDFVFSSHCLKDFAEPLPVMNEWLRVIKPLGKLLLLLPDMSDVKSFKGIAGFKCTEQTILKLIEKCPARIEAVLNTGEISKSFAFVIERLPTPRDEYKLVCTLYGTAVMVSETQKEITVIYADKSQKTLLKKDVSVQANCRFPDILYHLGGM